MSDTPTNEPYFDPELYPGAPDEAEAKVALRDVNVAEAQREEFEASVDEPQPSYDDGSDIPTPAEAGKATKPKYIVIGDNLVCQTSDGELSFPLRFKTKLLRQLGTFRDLDETDQLFWLLENVGQKAVAERLEELDVFETLGIVGEYFRQFEKRAQAAKGESSGSQSS